MDSKMKSELSFLLDNELDADRQQVLLTAMRNDAKLRSAWDDYLLIGDALRRSPDLHVDLTSRVMDELRHEPTVLAPRVRPSPGALRYGAALAASLTGVAVVGWLALQPMQPTPSLLQKTPLATVQPTKLATVAVANAGRMQEYLVAHQAYSPSNRFDGGASYIRTVSASR
jgi:negative regulator of sigma E activity